MALSKGARNGLSLLTNDISDLHCTDFKFIWAPETWVCHCSSLVYPYSKLSSLKTYVFV